MSIRGAAKRYSGLGTYDREKASGGKAPCECKVESL